MTTVKCFAAWLAATIVVCSLASPAWCEEPAPSAPNEPPPLPFHTIEGVGGGAITPMAYLVNPGAEDAVFGKPAIAYSYVNLGAKNLGAFTITETLWRTVELGYGADRLGLGRLPSAIRDATGVDVGHNDVWLHHLNAKVALLDENSPLGGDLPLPAVSAGVHVKINDGIDEIDQRLGGALSQIGYANPSGVDFTVTCTKTVPPDVLGRPLIVTGGVRASQAAQLGFLGFGDEYHAPSKAVSSSCRRTTWSWLTSFAGSRTRTARSPAWLARRTTGTASMPLGS